MASIPRMSPRQVATGEVSVDEQQAELLSWLNRHRITRRTAMKGAAGGVGALAVSRLALPGRAFAAAAAPLAGVKPGSYHLSFSGRHIAFGPDPANQMWLSVQLSGKPPSGRGTIIAEYGRTTDYGGTADVEVRELVSVIPQAKGGAYTSQQYYLHALVSGLDAAQLHHYRWRLADGTVTPDATFTTAPKAGSVKPFTFTAIADEGINDQPKGLNEAPAYPGESAAGTNGFNDDYYSSTDTMRSKTPANTLVELIAADQAAFNLVGGDICYADPSGEGLLIDNLSTSESYDSYDPFVWDSYLALIDQAAASSPWMFASGNHDMEMVATNPNKASTLESGYQPHGYGGLLERLDLGFNGPLSSGVPNGDPGKQSFAPTVYSFVYGNVAVLSIDANDLSYEIPANLDYSKGAQAKWIENQLASYRTKSYIDFIVAFFHQCAYCTGTTHGSDGGVRDVLDPLFTAYKVDLVFQGHNHQYERTDPIKHTQPTKVAPIGSTIFPALEGTTYVVVGSGGRPRYAFSAPDQYAGHDPSSSKEAVKAFVDDLGGTTTDETVYWSRVRYDDYAYAKVLATPAAKGERTTLTVSAISDLKSTVDHFTLSRTAGEAATETYTPPATTPEVSKAILLPVAGLAIAGGAAYLHHRGKATEAPTVEA
jgi:hypothetical protein